MTNLDRIFKAFIVTRGKIPSKSYKDPENQFTLDEVKGARSYAGLLAEESVLVDLDNVKEAELLLSIIKAEGVKCRVHKTDSGLHVFFLGHHIPTTRTKFANVIGLDTDYKLGTRNGIAILKLNGKEREVVYETDEIGPLPPWLYPVSSEVPEFFQMGNGSGRNDALYRYILTLQSVGLTKEESREAIRIINQYVLKDPLPERELATILRDDAFPSESFYDQKGKLQVRKFEEHFCREVNAIKLDTYLHIYKDGVYITGEDAIRGRMLDFLPDLSFTQRNEVLNRSKDRIQTFSKRAPANLMLFKNGTYDIKTDRLLPNSPENIITNMTPWNYNPDAYCEATDKTLNKLACGDPKLRMLLEEMIGAGLYRSNTLAGGKFFVLLGDNSNGKSTYFHMLRGVLGEENYCSLSIQDLNKQFRIIMIMNKLAIIGDDIPKTWVDDASILKKAVTGERIVGEYKGKDGKEFDPYCTGYFSANEMPRIDDGTGAVKRRMIPVPFNAKFSPDDPDFDPDIKEKLLSRESMEYLIRLGIEGLKRVRKTNRYTITSAIERELNTIDELNNPIIGFIEEVGEEGILNQSTKSVYDAYKTYCIECGLNPVALNSFTRQINSRMNTTTVRRMVNGESFKLFVTKDGDVRT